MRIALLLATLIYAGDIFAVEDSLFEEPVFLKVGSEPLNEDGKIMYPSPAIFDIDNDGADELVLGSIFGGLYSCEERKRKDGMPVWKKPEVVDGANGKPVKLNNW